MSLARQPLLRFFGSERLPILLQSESAECGLACLAMVASYFGHHIDLPGMRRRFSISLKGATLKNLIKIADAMGLQARPLKLKLEDLDKLKAPCILHWDMNHFVVMEKVSRDSVIIHDPAVGRRKMLLSQISDHFTGIALELTPGSAFRSAEETLKVSLRSLVGRITGLKRGLFQLLILGLVLQICILVSPFYLQWVVDEALVANDRDLITVLGVGFLLLVFIQTAVGAVRGWVTTVIATNLNFQWLNNAFAHLLKLPLPYFERRHLGDIVSRFGSIHSIQNALTTQLVESIIDGILVLATLIVMIVYSPRLAAVPVVAVSLYAIMRWIIFRALREATAQQIIHAAKQQTHFLESVRGIQAVRLFCGAEERRVGWMNILADQFNAELRIARLSISYQTAQGILFGAERVLVIWLAALAISGNQFSLGMLFAFISYKDQFTSRVSALIDKFFELRMLRLHGERVADILLTSIERDNVQDELVASRIEPSVEARNLSFRYADGEAWVLRNVDLKISAGQCVAIVGISGCGKTTLVKLLLGLLEPTEGEIFIGGERLLGIGLANYRQMVSSVMQEDHLFAGSIADNISFFDPEASLVRITKAATQAFIHEEIVAMPMAYNTLVGDIGSGLSGGQRQRILLARALYRSPSILFLDEATSHLDVANEKAIAAGIKQADITRVLVAHRPETIAAADRIVVLAGGRVVEDSDKVQRDGEILSIELKNSEPRNH